MTKNSGIVAVATSIAPALVRRNAGQALPEYQDFCIRSWVDNGFRIISINHPDEIPALAICYPDVTFIPTSRNASAWTGRKNPYIADLLLALKDAPEPVLGIINSDLLFEPSAAWATNLPAIVEDSLVIAHRYEVRSLVGERLLQYPGLDCFFFNRAVVLAALENAMPYAMGVPWWDFWLPIVALSNGCGVAMVDRPAILHLSHPAAYSETVWREFASIFVSSVTREFEKNPNASDIVADVMPSIREMGKSPLQGREFKRVTRPFAQKFIPAIRRKVVKWYNDPGQPEVISRIPASIFERLEPRIAAGDALIATRDLCKKGKWSEIGPKLFAALKECPNDPEILSALAEISYHLGDSEKADELIAKALELAPDEIMPLQTFGDISWDRGNLREALDCFQKLLSLNPRHQKALGAIAKLLWAMERKPEALAFLERTMAHNPDLLRIAELHAYYRQKANRQGSDLQKIASRLGTKACRIIERIGARFASRRPSNPPGDLASPSAMQSPPHPEL